MGGSQVRCDLAETVKVTIIDQILSDGGLRFVCCELLSAVSSDAFRRHTTGSKKWPVMEHHVHLHSCNGSVSENIATTLKSLKLLRSVACPA